MITTAFTNTAPMNFNVLAQLLVCEAVSIPVSTETGSFCWCNYVCAPSLNVFSGDTDLTNDKSSFIFYRIGASDTVAMTLWKNGAQVATLVNNTYGTYYNFGDLNNADLKGYLIDWGLVYTAFGGGEYRIKATSVLLGTTFNFESTKFKLRVYNELAADQTVRIETYQNGTVESSPIDFTNVNWYSQVRLPGNIRNKQPEFTTDNYKDSLRDKIQIQDSIANTYTLEMPEIDEAIKDVIVEDVLLSNRIIITDYSIDNSNRYKATELYPSEIDNLTYKTAMPGCSLVVKFTDKRENIIKRNRF